MKEKNRLNKIVMIGPVYPYKGGISHYTGMMYRYLAKKYNVEMISYKMQYPKFLFKKEQKDYENDAFKIDNTRYWINTANPLNILKVGFELKKMKPDLIIFQWWHPYFAPCYWLLEILLHKFDNLFLCHNVFPHERFFLDKKLTRGVLKKGDSFIVHSLLDANDLKKIVKSPNYKNTVHPTYNVFKMKNLSKKDGRKILGLKEEEQVILFFGFIRKYKGLKYLIEAMKEIKMRLPLCKLLVVGDFDGDKEEYLRQIESLEVEEAISIYDGYIPDNEVEKFFAACDLVVLPYESATQSGIVQISYGFEKPCVVTNVGGLPEVVLDGKTGYVIEPKSPSLISEAVCDYFTNTKELIFKEQIKNEAYKFSWERMVESIEKLYYSGGKE